MGVAAAYKLLLDTYRIECNCVPGKYKGYPHMINVVEIDSKRAYVDVSRGLKEKAMPMIRYDYFLVSDSRIRDYFTPDEDFGCVDDDMSYFVKNKLVFKDSISLRKYLSSFNYQRTSGKIRVLYTGKAMDDDDLKKFMDEIILPRCGSEYKMYPTVTNGKIGNCKISKLEEE